MTNERIAELRAKKAEGFYHINDFGGDELFDALEAAQRAQEGRSTLYKMFVWTDRISFLAVAHAETAGQARELLFAEMGGSGDGSCPERDKARQYIRTETPEIWRATNAEFALTDSADLREQEMLNETLEKERDSLRTQLAEAQRLHEAVGELIEVAGIRGDDDLPAPERDPLPFTARMQTAWNDLRQAYVSTRAAIAAPEPQAEAPAQPSRCTVPPPGWECTRTPGHDGPCAAVPAQPSGPTAWDMRGGSIWLGREEWGVIIDALIEHRQSTTAREGRNPERTHLDRMEMCEQIIRRIGESDPYGLQAGKEQGR